MNPGQNLAMFPSPPYSWGRPNFVENEIMRENQKQKLKMPKECGNCPVTPGCGIGCDDCGHYPERRAALEENYIGVF
jgi:radical SAM protein with 4Fe4S-binding SPASM domain